jgi:hypothetical protein
MEAKMADLHEPDLTEADSIDPATGHYWRVGQAEFWTVAARAHRQHAADEALTDKSRLQNLAEAARCDRKAAEIRASMKAA